MKTIFLLLLSSCTVLPDCFGQKHVTNLIGMKFVRVDTGSFVVGEFRPPYPTPEDTVKYASTRRIMWMGTGRGYNTAEFALAKHLAQQDSRPGFVVKIKDPFYVGVFEITQGQWKAVMGDNPSTFQGKDFPSADSLPVESVTWKDAHRFIEKLNRLDKRNRYRLPNEFEWEFAARAGAQTDISWDSIRLQAHLGTRSTQPVGKLKPNAFGIYDMLGNVWEWVDDYYNEKIFADKTPPKTGKEHVVKGGSFSGDVKNATYMTHAAGPGNGWDVGFRVIMQPRK